MTINRHNYEEFFILYLDNELSSEGRRQVEFFVEQHPDLGEELQLLEQTRLELDPSVVFDAKESLMKPVGLGWINADNQEEWLVQYIDNELNNEQKAAVEIYTANNPSVKAELELLRKTKSRPEVSITFLNKESLYRREEKPVLRMVPVRLLRVAAAVLLLIALTTGGFLIFNNNNTERGLADTGPRTKISGPSKVDEKKIPGEQTESDVPNINGDKSIEKQNTLSVVAKKNDKTTKIVKESNEEDNPNNLPDGSRNPNMDGSVITRATLVADNGLTIPQEKNSPPLVTSGTPQSFIQANNTLTTDEEVAINEPEKKTKFRGLLRTLTRTFEKTTNIKATDEEDRLLVAGLAIRL
jgi:hypothetical protein